VKKEKGGGVRRKNGEGGVNLRGQKRRSRETTNKDWKEKKVRKK